MIQTIIKRIITYPDESLKVLRKRANEEPVYYADEKNTGGIPAELKTNTTTTSKSYSDDHGVNDHGKNDNDAGDKDPGEYNDFFRIF